MKKAIIFGSILLVLILTACSNEINEPAPQDQVHTDTTAQENAKTDPVTEEISEVEDLNLVAEDEVEIEELI